MLQVPGRRVHVQGKGGKPLGMPMPVHACTRTCRQTARLLQWTRHVIADCRGLLQPC